MRGNIRCFLFFWARYFVSEANATEILISKAKKALLSHSAIEPYDLSRIWHVSLLMMIYKIVVNYVSVLKK